MCKISFEREKDSISCWGEMGGKGSELHWYTLSDIVGKVCDTCWRKKKNSSVMEKASDV